MFEMLNMQIKDITIWGPLAEPLDLREGAA